MSEGGRATAANASWHNDIWPEWRTSSPKDKKRMMFVNASDHKPDS